MSIEPKELKTGEQQDKIFSCDILINKNHSTKEESKPPLCDEDRITNPLDPLGGRFASLEVKPMFCYLQHSV